jgi:hypothetical protein
LVLPFSQVGVLWDTYRDRKLSVSLCLFVRRFSCVPGMEARHSENRGWPLRMSCGGQPNQRVDAPEVHPFVPNSEEGTCF